MKRITKIESVKDNSSKKLRVAAYARVSTDSDKQLISLEAQKNHYERYIKARSNWEYAGLYFDEGVTGTKVAKRDGLLRMLEDCDRGLIDYIIVKSISRFSRNTVDSIEMVRSLNEKGIHLFFEKENIDTGKMEGELLLSILSSIAENESHSLAENNRWGILRRFQSGTYKISFPPYGYDNAQGKMVINPEQADIVRRIFKSVLNGRSTLSVAKELNRLGITGKRGGKWTAATVSEIVRNEKYIGDMLLQKRYTDDRFIRRINRGERAQYYVKDHHEPIISREDFDAANAIIDFNAQEKGYRKGEIRSNNRYVTTGKIFCNECGGTMIRHKSHENYVFKCTTHLKDKNACHAKDILEDAVKMAFATMMNKLVFARNKILIPLSTTLGRGLSKDQIRQRKKVESMLQDIMQRRNQLHQFFTKGLLDPPIYQEEDAKLQKEEKKLLAEKMPLASDAIQKRRENLSDLLRYTAKREMITGFDDQLFTEFVDHIVVFNRTEIGFVMKCGPVFRERI